MYLVMPGSSADELMTSLIMSKAAGFDLIIVHGIGNYALAFVPATRNGSLNAHQTHEATAVPNVWPTFVHLHTFIVL